MVERNLEHLELLSIAEKDEQYIKNWIGNNLQDLAQSCLGVRKWIQYKSAITFITRFTYFGMTTLFNKLTPGEEYCEASVEPNFIRNLLLVILNNELRAPSEIPKQYIDILRELHLIIFFLYGDFYELPKRFLGYNYTTLDTNTYQSQKMKYLYRLIGCFSIVKLIIKIKKQDQSVVEDQKISFIETELKSFDQNMTCHLCSNIRKEPTSTICGHIFCWYCIHQWLKERFECPICRTPTEPSRLIHLVNFK